MCTNEEIKDPIYHIIENNLWENFDRICRENNVEVAIVKDHCYLSSKIKNRLRSSVRSHVSDYIAQNIKIENLIDFSIEELAIEMTKKFKPGMSWEERTKWHIDHIVPKSKMKFKKIGDSIFKECMSIKNLQPLWAKENLKKSSKNV